MVSKSQLLRHVIKICIGITETEMTYLAHARQVNQYSVVVNFRLDFDKIPYENLDIPSAKFWKSISFTSRYFTHGLNLSLSLLDDQS